MEGGKKPPPRLINLEDDASFPPLGLTPARNPAQAARATTKPTGAAVIRQPYRSPPNPPPAQAQTAPATTKPTGAAVMRQPYRSPPNPPPAHAQAAPATTTPTGEAAQHRGALLGRPPPNPWRAPGQRAPASTIPARKGLQAPFRRQAQAPTTPVFVCRPFEPSSPKYLFNYDMRSPIHPVVRSLGNKDLKVLSSTQVGDNDLNKTQGVTKSAQIKLGLGAGAKYVTVRSPGPVSPLQQSQRLTTFIPKSDLGPLFLDFIRRYIADGERGAYYKAQASMMHACGIFQLKVDFNHMLESLILDKENKILDLVLWIGNSDRHSWLNPFIRTFLEEELHDKEGFAELMEIINSKPVGVALVSFRNKPNRVQKLRDVLEDKSCPVWRIIKVMADRCSILAATTQGRLVFRAILAKLLNIFRHDKWYAGKLCIDDFLFLDSVKCFIIRPPVSLSSPSWASKDLSASAKEKNEGKKNNLEDTWTMMEDYYSVDGKLPIYFSSLKDSLVNATIEDVKEPWFLNFLEHHFALMSSMARRTFVCDAAEACRMFHLASDENLKAVLVGKPNGNDWRELVYHSGDSLLNNLFWCGTNLEEYKDIAEHIKSREYTNIPLAYYLRSRQNTFGAFLLFKRNVLMHLDDYIVEEMEKEKGKEKGTVVDAPKVIQDMDEVELFATACLPQAENTLLQCVMKHYQTTPGFHGILSTYVALISDLKDLPGL